LNKIHSLCCKVLWVLTDAQCLILYIIVSYHSKNDFTTLKNPLCFTCSTPSSHHHQTPGKCCSVYCLYSFAFPECSKIWMILNSWPLDNIGLNCIRLLIHLFHSSVNVQSRLCICKSNQSVVGWIWRCETWRYETFFFMDHANGISFNFSSPKPRSCRFLCDVLFKKIDSFGLYI